ncbi:MAG TPA: RNA-binding domain-containing protein [Pyrinomonadaceae bacterium]|jgi:predicted HTH transcriptional regulator|nr:RNA-binding domain-containing protein [Pyrinomonadaceae bacterium]
MARRKFRNQRNEPSTERSYQEYVLSTPAPQTSRDELMRLVRGGEDTFLELKVKLSNPEKITQGIVALANTGGGLIVFGVNDNLRVEGVDDAEEVREELVRICREEIVPSIFPYIDLISFDNGRRIVALDVEGKRRPYRTRDGRFYLRVGAEKREATREELSILMDDARPVRFENIPVVAASVADIDEAHLWSFVREFEGDAYVQPNAANGYPTGEVLERDLLLATPARDGDFIPTVAALLLFGRDERVAALLPRSSVTAVRFAGDTTQAPKVESLQLQGNLHTLYEASLRFIRRYCDLEDARPRTLPGRTETEADADPAEHFAARSFYHRGAVGEALANALVHRDLSLRDQTTRIHIFDRAIEILNPRRTHGFAPSAQKAIRYGVPQQLNPQLAALFRNPAYGLSLPHGGLPMLLRQSRLFSARRTEIHAFNDEFRLRLYGV